MQVILRSDLDGLGKRGDIVDVADGHARNYLLPKGLALKATPGAVDQAAKMRRCARKTFAPECQLLQCPNKVPTSTAKGYQACCVESLQHTVYGLHSRVRSDMH